MRVGKLKIALLLVCCAVFAFEIWHLRQGSGAVQQTTPATTGRHEPSFALLPASEIANYANQFAVPKPHLESWEPTVGEVDDLESNLSQISTLSEKFHDPNRRIDDPRQFFRQYLAIERDRNKVIFVNALCRIDPPDSNEWRKHLIDTADGGKCFWKATYSPAKHIFSNLFVNGMG